MCLLLLFVVGGIILLSNSYALFKKEITGRNVELKVGELSYNLESEKLENNQITLKPNSSETFEVTLTSLNEIDSKYELFYKIISPETLENTVDGGYLETSENPSSGVINANSSKNIQLVLNNFGNQEIAIEIGVQAGLTHNEVVLNDGEITLKEKDFQKQYVYDYTGDYQTFAAPVDGTYKVELWGATGGIYLSNYGTGAHTSGIIQLEKNFKIYIYIGSEGNSKRQASFNGGGTGGLASNRYGDSGGGATDIRLINGLWNDFDSLKSRIMVAAGGGGTTDEGYNTGGEGSFAGGLNGYSGGYYRGHTYQHQNGGGATQTQGGIKGNNIFNATGTAYSGSFGIGGNNDTISSALGAGGGGGGYYGGGAGGGTQESGRGQGGGGGSSFISGHLGCDAISKESTSSNIIHTGQPNHYSGKVFTDTVMIDGAGYNWTTTKGEKTDMPTHDLTSTMTGNTGNGYARITYLGK